MNLVGEPRLEEICFFMGIPKCGRLWAKREVIYEGHEASIGEADLLFGGVVVVLMDDVTSCSSMYGVPYRYQLKADPTDQTTHIHSNSSYRLTDPKVESQDALGLSSVATSLKKQPCYATAVVVVSAECKKRSDCT